MIKIIILCILLYVLYLNIKSMKFSNTKIISSDDPIVISRETLSTGDTKDSPVMVDTNQVFIESGKVSNKLSKELKMKKQDDPVINFDLSHKILNKLLGQTSAVDPAIKAPKLENFDDYAPEGIEKKSVQSPMVKYKGSSFNPEANNNKALDKGSANYKSEMTAIYNEKNPATAHENDFNDVSGRKDIGNTFDWEH